MGPKLKIPLQTLAGMELFQTLPCEILDLIAAGARVRCLPRDLCVFHQGDEDVRAHVVIEGGVRIVQSGGDGAQILVRFIGPGEMFGTVALFTDRRYPADAITLAETLEASWSEAELLELMSRYPQIAINAIRIVGTRLQEIQDRARELATQSVERRIAHALLRLAHQAGHSSVEGTAIGFPLRRKDVADIAGTTLHTASRILTIWQKAGLLLSRRQQLTIRRPAEILRIAEDEAV